MNIAVIVADTLRLDAFEEIEARKGRFSSMGFYFYRHCIAPASWTLPSHASLFTGLYPSEHGAHETRDIKALDIERIRLRLPTVVERLNSLDFSTYAYSANPYVSPVYGFSGFKRFVEESYFTDVFGSVVEVANKLKPMLAEYRNLYGTNAIAIAKHVLSEDPGLFLEALSTAALLTPKSALIKLKAKLIDGWPIEKGGRNMVKAIKESSMKKPFFLFVNLMEAHDPYIGDKKKDMDWATPFLKQKPDRQLVRKWKRLYAKASERAYAYAAEIAEHVLNDDALVVFTSDHGQAFGEHGFFGHGTVLYDQLVKVPLAIRLPKGYELAKDNAYESLVLVKEFLLRAIAKDKHASSALLSREVRAESFGVPANITAKDIDKKKLRAYDRPRVRRFRQASS